MTVCILSAPLAGEPRRYADQSATIVILALLLTTMGGLAAGAETREHPSGKDQTPLHSTLRSGDYDVTFVATKGIRAGTSIHAHLALRPTSVDDSSPVTGEVAADRDLSGTPLYGWIDADFLAIAAPIGSLLPPELGLCRDEPPPESRDPVKPGVLVHTGGHGAMPMLTVSTLDNLRTGEEFLDGCGIALLVEKLEQSSFCGVWIPFGRLGGGSGQFCARFLDE